MKTWKKLLSGAAVAAVCVGGPLRAQTQNAEPAMAGMGRMVRGTVTAAAGDKLSVKTATGEMYTVALSANTRVMKGREPAKAADVHVGDAVVAMGEVDQPNKTIHPLNMMVIDAEQVKKMREAMGKTYIAGRVTAIDETRLTVMREDGVSQTIAVDEDTAFRKGGRGMQMMFAGPGAAAGPAQNDAGEAVTLADVKVGDTVAGPGALKSGTFVPTTLMIGTPGQGGGQRRRRQQGEGSAPNAEPK